MRFVREETCKKVVWYTLFGLCILGCGYLFCKILFRILLPFFLAWITAFCVQPAVRLLHRRTRLPKKLLGCIFALAVLFALGTVCALCIRRIWLELSQLCAYLAVHGMEFADTVARHLLTLQKHLPILKFFGEPDAQAVQTFCEARLSEFLSAAVNRLPSLVTFFGKMIPEALLFTAVLIMAVFCFCADFSNFNASLLRHVPETFRLKLHKIKRHFVRCFCHVAKAYLILFVITFAQLWIGFLILRLPYALTLALVTAFLDILPVLGVGTVLIPFALWMLFTGRVATAIGLLILYLVITLLRQILEPKIVGSSIGLSAIATLIAMYAGYRAVGVGGMILAPVLVMLAKEVFAALTDVDSPSEDSPKTQPQNPH